MSFTCLNTCIRMDASLPQTYVLLHQKSPLTKPASLILLPTHDIILRNIQEHTHSSTESPRVQFIVQSV